MNRHGEFFDSFAEKFNSLYDGKRNWLMQWMDKKFRSDMFLRFHMTFDFLGDLGGKRILDVGCGSGPYIVEALKRGASHATGIDPAPRMLALARQRVAAFGMLDKITLIEGYFPQACPDETFDYAIVMGVMDYIQDPVEFLSFLVGRIRYGAVISFPSTHWFRTPLRKVRYKVRNCPVYFYTISKIEHVLREAEAPRFQIARIPGAGMDYVVTMGTVREELE